MSIYQLPARKSSEYSPIFFLLLTVALTLFSLQVFHDPHSAFGKLLFFSVSFVVSMMRPVIGFFLVVGTLSWWEVLTLQVGYPNQFLIEPAILGFVCGAVVRSRPTTESCRVGALHPLFAPLCLLIFYILLTEVAAWSELVSFSYDGVGIAEFLSLIGRNVGSWNVKTNPIHPLSLVLAYVYQVLFILVVVHLIRAGSLNRGKVLDGIAFGALLPCLIGLLQFFSAELIPGAFAVGPSGTFQNSNHLSFFAGLVFVISLYRAWTTTGWIQTVHRLLLVLSLSGLVIGGSRTAYVAFVPAVVATIIAARGVFQKWSRWHVSTLAIIGAGSLAFFLSLAIEHYWDSSTVIESVADSVSKLLLAAPIPENRIQNYFVSIVASLQHPVNGLGAGLLFRKVNAAYETHSALLWMLESFGFAVTSMCVLAFLAGLMRLLSSIRPTREAAFAIMLMVYLVFCLLPDNYLSYRSLLSAVSLAMLAWIPIKGPALPTFRMKPLLMLTGLVALHSLYNPMSVPLSSQTWRFEENPHAPTGESRWTGPYLTLPMQAGKCTRVWAHPIFPEGTTEVAYGNVLNDAAPTSFSTLSDSDRSVLRSATGKFELINGKWQSICLCRMDVREQYQNYGFVYARRGQYLSLSRRHYSQDDRFITFGSTKPQLHDLGEFWDDPSSCDILKRL